jgi:hypothetical protein
MRAKSPRWAAAITGPEHDLAELAKHLPGRTRIYRGREGWELTDDGWETLDELVDVHAAVEQLTTHLRALVRFHIGRGRPIRYSGNLFERTGRNRHKHIYPAEPADDRARHAMTTDMDATSKHRAPASWGAALDLARRDTAVARAFDFFSVEPNWHTLDAALDPVRRDDRTGGIEGIVRRGWATASQLGLFTQTTQGYVALDTNGSGDGGPPPLRAVHPDPPMTLAEAEKLVGGIVAAWIDRLLLDGR